MLLAFGQLLIITTGSIDISIGSNLGFSAFMAALGMTWFGPAGFIVGIIAAMIIGTLNGLIFSILKISSFVTTLSMLIMVRAVLIIISDGGSIYLTDTAISEGSNITAVYAPWLLSLGRYPNILIFSAVVAVLLWVFYEKTVFGQQLKALGGNEKVLKLGGIPVTLFKIQVFAAGGFLVGLASFINLARAGAATPQAGQMMELDAIAAVALGGTVLTGGYGSVLKTVVGALTLTIVANGLTIAGVPPSWSRIARGVLLITAIAISLNRQKIDVVK
jgi:ribose/xylose/arabinose/galactoside ABC-type transport system permease subunit